MILSLQVWDVSVERAAGTYRRTASTAAKGLLKSVKKFKRKTQSADMSPSRCHSAAATVELQCQDRLHGTANSLGLWRVYACSSALCKLPYSAIEWDWESDDADASNRWPRDGEARAFFGAAKCKARLAVMLTLLMPRMLVMVLCRSGWVCLMVRQESLKEHNASAHWPHKCMVQSRANISEWAILPN